MYIEITSEQLRQLEMLFPTGFAIVIKIKEEHCGLYQFVPTDTII